MMKCSSLRNDTAVIINIQGAVGNEESTSLKEFLDSLDLENCTKLVFDLRNLVFINSAAIGILISYFYQFKKKDGGKTIELINVCKTIRMIFESLQIQQFVELR